MWTIGLQRLRILRSRGLPGAAIRRRWGALPRPGISGPMRSTSCIISQGSPSRMCALSFTLRGPKAMEDTAFMTSRLANGAPGTLWVTQAAPGNYCALRIRIFGEAGGIEWDQEKPEYLRFNRLNDVERVIVRGNVQASCLRPSASSIFREGMAKRSAMPGEISIQIAIAVGASGKVGKCLRASSSFRLRSMERGASNSSRRQPTATRPAVLDVKCCWTT